MMKVIELIGRLQQLPPEGEVKLTERDLSRLFGRLEAERIAHEEELLRICRECADYARRNGVSLARAMAEMFMRMISKDVGVAFDWERIKSVCADRIAVFEGLAEKEIAEAGGEEAWVSGGSRKKGRLGRA